MEEKSVFDLFEPRLKKLVKRRFKIPTNIQELVMPSVLKGKNALIISGTGSGKTESVLLPVFDLWLKDKPKPISILYITPLKSLNRDMLKRIIWWANKLEFEVSVRHGDTSQYERYMQAQNPSDLLISTPETLQAILTGKILRKHLRNIKYIIIDEVHEMVSNKRGVQLTIALSRLKNLIKQNKGTEPMILCLSATIGSPESVINFFGIPEADIINTSKNKNIDIKVELPKTTSEDKEMASKAFILPNTTTRLRKIIELIEDKKSVLVFTNTRESAEVLSSRIKVLYPDISIDTHHSSLSKEVRINTEENFKNGKVKALLCTSSLELGIDVGSIDFILQYMSPRQITKILQRIGRSGHTFDKVSAGIIIAGDSDDCFESSVIAKHAISNMIEPTKIYSKSLDVLAHQVIGLVMDDYKIPMKEAYNLIKTAYPYKNLKESEFRELCKLLQRLGLLWIDEKQNEEKINETVSNKGPLLKRRKKAFEYYFQNMSTIPDVKNYQIFDNVSNRPVGTLDAEFIALHGALRTTFICKGQSWRIIEIGKKRIIVEPAHGIEAAIPAWEGELIPVPYDVAQNVGKIRRNISEKIKLKETKKQIISDLMSKYPVTINVATKMYDTTSKQVKFGFVPDDKKILIEYNSVFHSQNVKKKEHTYRKYSGFGDIEPINSHYVIFHTCFGSLVNETLGRLLSVILTNRLGSVGLQTDPYRIILKMQNENQWKDAVDTFKKLKSEMLQLLLLAVPNTDLFKYRFIHVAKRFGVISKESDYGKNYMKKIVDVYAGTPVFKETMNEVLEEKLDFHKTEEILERLHEIEIEVRKGFSYLGKIPIEKRYEIIASKKPEKEIFNVFKERLLNTRVKLLCCNCGMGITYTVRNVSEKPKCIKCKSKMLGIVKMQEKDETEKEILMNKFLNKKSVTKEETKIINYIQDTASLVSSSGKNAVIILAGRGIGLSTASRILRKRNKNDEFFMDILKAERIYARTKQYWK